MTIQNLADVLVELREASINSSPNTVKSLMSNYNMLFTGSKFNTIYSEELRHCLDKKFNYLVSSAELNSLLPKICKTLNMKLNKLIAVEDIGQLDPMINYEITLWE